MADPIDVGLNSPSAAFTTQWRYFEANGFTLPQVFINGIWYFIPTNEYIKNAALVFDGNVTFNGQFTAGQTTFNNTSGAGQLNNDFLFDIGNGIRVRNGNRIQFYNGDNSYNHSLREQGNELYIINSDNSNAVRFTNDGNIKDAAGTLFLKSGQASSDPSIAGNYVKYVDTIANMQAYTGTNPVEVTGSRGGVFVYSATGTADNGVTFTRTAGGYWVRQYESANGVNVDWWGSDSSAIQSAVTKAGVNGIINFGNAKTYLSTEEIYPLLNQRFNGNYSTYFRQAETIVTLSVLANSTDNSITVSSVPSTWKVGNYVQIYIDNTTNGSSPRRKIQSIAGNLVTFTTTIGTGANTGSTTYPIGSKARKVFHMFSSPTVNDIQGDGINNTINNPFSIYNLIFDGNKDAAGNNDNYYWAVNACIYNMGRGSRIEKCLFQNVPNDCINGHGFTVFDCQAYNLNNSFVHLSADNTTTGIKEYPTYIINNTTDTTNIKPSASFSTHSRGVIETSFSGGYYIAIGNRFANGNDAVFGYFGGGVSAQDAATQEVIIKGNYARNFAGGPFANNGLNASSSLPTYPGKALVEGNIFDNCGSTVFPADGDSRYTYTFPFLIHNNLLLNGTVLTTPTTFKNSTEYILNQTTVTQSGGLKLNGTISAGAFVGGTISGTTGTFSSTLRQGNNGLFTIPSGGASAAFTPTMGQAVTTGIAAIEVGVGDGTNNYRAGLVVNNTDQVWGLTHLWSSAAAPFVIRGNTTNWLRLTATTVQMPQFTTAGILTNDASGNVTTATALPSGTTATTQTAGDNTTKVATTAFVTTAIANSAAPTVDITSTTVVNAVPGTKYYAAHAGLSTILLPTTIAKGQQILVRGSVGGTGLWRITQNAGQTIHGATNSTTGTGGYIASQAQYDTVALECVVANTDFVIIANRGTLTIV